MMHYNLSVYWKWFNNSVLHEKKGGKNAIFIQVMNILIVAESIGYVDNSREITLALNKVLIKKKKRKKKTDT